MPPEMDGQTVPIHASATLLCGDIKMTITNFKTDFVSIKLNNIFKTLLLL